MLTHSIQLTFRALITALCVFVLPQTTYCNETDNTHFLHQLEQQNSAIQLISGTFTQAKTLSILPAPLFSSGSFVFQPNTGLQWNTVAPIKSSLVLNQQGVQLNGKVATQPNAQVNNTGQATVTALFLAVIGGDLNQLRNYFDIKPVSTDIQNWRLQLTPKTKQLAAHIKQITIHGASNTERLVIFEANGDKTDIQLDTTTLERKTIEQ
jgi:outer membrane lipoprotein-sorting protein